MAGIIIEGVHYMPPLKPGDHVVFVCVGNHTRSPLAAAMFARIMKAHGIDCKVESAGTMRWMHDLGAASEWARLRYTRDYDLSAHRNRHYSELELTPETFVICLDDRAHEEMENVSDIGKDRLHLLLAPRGVFDPSASFSMEAYEMCFWQLKRGIEQLIRQLLDE